MLSLIRRTFLILLTIAISPVLLLVGITLLFFNLVHVLTRFTRRPAPMETAPLSGLATIVVLNWNGKDLLSQGIPSVLEAVRRDGRPHEILVVDNGSDDGSVQYLRSEFPEVRILELPENLGFAAGNNAGVKAARHDVVVLLNNDMVVERNFLRPLLDGFRPGTFAVSSQIFLQDPKARREETGKTTAAFRRGMIDYAHDPIADRKLPRSHYPAFWAGGGSSAFHRSRYLSLGGLQEVFSPAYVEDTDLSFQAWKVGWEVLFAPSSIVYHKHRASSTRRFLPIDLEILVKRNQFLFIWKNIRSWRLLLSHVFFLPWNCYRLSRDHGIKIWRALGQAIALLPSVEIARLGAPYRTAVTDTAIFKLFGKPGLFFLRRGADLAQEDRPRLLWLTAYLPHLGRHAGAGRMFQLLKRMSAKYRITLLSFLETDDEQEFLPELEELCDHVVAMRRRPPFRWQIYAYEPFDEFLTPGMQRAMQDYLEDFDYSLIQLEYTQMACYADPELGIPTLLTKHEVDFAACARRAAKETRLTSKIRWFYNFLQVMDREVRLQRRVSAAICMTDPDAEVIRRYCPSVPVHVINTGVDLEYFTPPPAPSRENRLIFVGAFQHLPNVDAMVYFCREILPLISQSVPDASLTIVGSKPSPEIVALAQIPNVEVTGFVSDIRIPTSRSAVYVVPLRLGVGIRGKILEAWGMAMPVVATSVACAGLRFENGINILVADTPREFAAQVVSLLGNPARRVSLGREGRRVAEEHYGWEASAAKLDALYRETIASNRNPGPGLSPTISESRYPC